jgi:hypothetical protein
MADPTAFYEPEEDELLSSLAVPSFQNAEGYEDDYRRMQELEQHAFAQHAETGEMGLEMVPEDVKRVSGRAARIEQCWSFGDSVLCGEEDGPSGE